MAAINYEVYEDNGGMIRLYILESSTPVLMMSGIEQMERGELGEILADISTSDDVSQSYDWDDVDQDGILESYNEDTTMDGIELIADQNGIYEDAMGIAGDMAMYRYWYAVEMDEDDNDWGTGSHDYDKAVAMAERMGAKFIAVIEQGADPTCVRVEEV